MELQVQKLLRSGWTLEKLKEEYGIVSRVNETLDVVCLNYNQILSPMGSKVVQECRALVLRRGTWDVCSWAFPKFFNLGEGHIPKDFNWDKFYTLEKLDGSLVHFWWHNVFGWQCGTRSVPDAETGLDDTGLTFKQLIIKTINDMGSDWNHFTSFFEPEYCYAFELTTPENQIVCDYKGKRLLTLIGIRKLLSSLREIDIYQWEFWTSPPFPVVKRYEGWSLDDVQANVGLRDPKEHEGYVLVDENFNRVKIKSQAYVFMSGRKDSLQKSNKARIELILADAADDVVPTLPEYVQGKIRFLQNRIKVVVQQIDSLWATVKDIEGDKEFAMAVQHTGWSTPMFALRKGKASDGLGFLKKSTPKRVLEYIDIKEEEND